jgi:anti-sigma factor RsiW
VQEVKTINENDLKNHPQDMLLGYLEGTLSLEDHDMVVEHLGKCEECAWEMYSLGKLAEILKSEKHVFCPEPWEWYEFIENGYNPGGRLSSHLEICPLCSAEVANYNHAATQKILPTVIKEALKEAYPETPFSKHPEAQDRFARIPNWLSHMFRFPTLAFGAALAAIIVVVMLYPRGNVPIFLGVSSEDWEESRPVAKSALPKSVPAQKESKAVGENSQFRKYTPQSRVAEQPKPKIAAVVLFHGFDKPLPQSTIDSLYGALRPTSEWEKRFEFSTPLQFKNFLDNATNQNLTPIEALNKFYKQSSVTFGIVVNIEAQSDKFGLKTRIIDARSGETLAESSRNGVSGTALASAVRESLSLLEKLKGESRTN